MVKMLDQSVVEQWNLIIHQHESLALLANIFGTYGVYIIPLSWLVWWFIGNRKMKQSLLSSIFAGIVAWQGLNRLLKLLYFHPRPLYSLQVRELLFTRPENSFPSDHAAFLAAIALFMLLQGNKKSGLWLSLLCVLVGLARIALALHYPSDIIVGMLSGLGVAWVIHVCHAALVKKVWEPLITLAERLHLG